MLYHATGMRAVRLNITNVSLHVPPVSVSYGLLVVSKMFASETIAFPHDSLFNVKSTVANHRTVLQCIQFVRKDGYNDTNAFRAG